MMEKKTLAWQDAEAVATCDFIPWEDVDGKTFVVTGATGLIGGAVVRALVARNELLDANVRIVALVRDITKASILFGDMLGVELVQWDAASGSDFHLPTDCDFVIHCAAPTASKLFVEKPVEVVKSILSGTASMLELAYGKSARMVYVSSMEVYGQGGEGWIDESRCGALDTMTLRSSYPVAKQAAEALCAAYASEYGVAVCSARLAQTFGAGVLSSDGRVFAQFARACMAGEDIHLLTAGTKENMYVYTADAVSALLLLALRGESGVAYNIANEETLTTICDMAESVLDRFGHKGSHVVFDCDEEAAKRYPKPGAIRLDTTRIRTLGWHPTYGLMDMYARLISSWEEE